MKMSKKLLAVMLCLSFLITMVTVEPVQAKRAANESVADYLNRCENSRTSLPSPNPKLGRIAYAYLVGEDDMAATSWLKDPVTNTVESHELYAVEPGTKNSGSYV